MSLVTSLSSSEFVSSNVAVTTVNSILMEEELESNLRFGDDDVTSVTLVISIDSTETNKYPAMPVRNAVCLSLSNSTAE